MAIDELIATLAQSPAPQKPARPPLVMYGRWLMASALYVVFLLLLSGIRPDLAVKLQTPLFLAEIGMLALVVASTGLSAMLLSFPDMHQSPGMALTPLVPIAGFAGLLYATWLMDVPPAPLPPHSFECSICIMLFSTVPAAGLFVILRRQASTHPYAAGAIALVNAFGIGALALRLSEHTDSAIHLIEWHYLPMLAAAAAGLLAGRLLLKW